MKKFSRRLQKTAPLLLLGLLLSQAPVSQKAQALVGGPFDDGGFPGVNADGTYSGTISGHNLTGIVSFGVSSSSETNGRFSIFHEGFVHYGTATGIADLQSRRVAGAFLGVAALTGSGIPVTNPSVGAVDSSAAVGSGTLANTSGSQGQSFTVRSGLEGSFIAQMKGYPHRIRFEGKGRLSTRANTAVVTTGTVGGIPNGFTVTIGANGSPEIQTDTTQDGTQDANIDAAGGNIEIGANVQGAILRSETPFTIRGSRTSRTVFNAILNYTGVAPTTLTGSTPVPSTPGATPPPVAGATPTPAP